MANATNNTSSDSALSTAERIRQRIEVVGEGYWRQQDFSTLPAPAVSQTLSRLARQGYLQRLGKGLYYRPRPTTFGASRPSQSAIGQLPVKRKRVFPAGVSAANLLGFTTQNPLREEMATSAGSFPRTLIGKETRLRTRRPDAWSLLKPHEAAMLDFMRERGMASELSPRETVQKLLAYFQEAEDLRAFYTDCVIRAAKSASDPGSHRTAARERCLFAGATSRKPQSSLTF